jgi:ATPase subunit of ABC transporter with duplicated ATPase domains
MAKAPKILSKAEIKAKTAELKAARKVVLDTFAPYASDVKAAEKTLADAKKQAEKTLAADQKAVDAAVKKAQKAADARDKGLAKIDAELAKLAPAPKEEAPV